MSRGFRFALAMPLLVVATTFACVAFTRIPVYLPPPWPWVAAAATSVTFILVAAVKGCVDWVYEGRP